MSEKMKRIEDLRRREEAGEPLVGAERTELDAYYQEVEAREAVYLAPATERLRAQRLAQEQSLRQLETLRARKHHFLAQMEAIAREVAAIETEESRLLAAAKA